MAWPHHPKRTATRVFDRIGQVGVAWSERMWTDAEPEIPDKRPGTRAQHAADLGQAARRVGPVVVHRQGTDDRAERPVGERQGGHVADEQRRPALAEATRLLDETPCDGIAVQPDDESWLSVSHAGLGGAPCGAGDGASHPVPTTPMPRAARRPL